MATPTADLEAYRHAITAAKAELHALDADLLGAMDDAYTQNIGRSAHALDALSRKIEEALAAGRPVSPAWLYQQRRLAECLDAMEVEWLAAARQAYDGTAAAEAYAVSLGVDHATTLLGYAIVDHAFTTPNLAALNNLILGVSAEGSPLAMLFGAIPQAQAEAFTTELIAGLVAGHGPRAVAAAASRASGVGRYRSMNIARTEMIRAYRMASLDTYRQNDDVVTGWTWHAAFGPRTCATCAAMHGTHHSLDETLDGHPMCRCAMVPDTIPLGRAKGVAVPSGVGLFRDLPANQQRAILGPAKYDAYRSGEITLQDIVGRTTHPGWGSMRSDRSLEAIRAEKEAGRDSSSWRIGAHPRRRGR